MSTRLSKRVSRMFHGAANDDTAEQMDTPEACEKRCHFMSTPKAPKPRDRPPPIDTQANPLPATATQPPSHYLGAPRLSLCDMELEIPPPLQFNQPPIERVEDPVRETRVFGSRSERPSVITLTPLRCRICYEEANTDDEPLISPCRCRGTVGLLHASCLQEWLAKAHTTECELCGYKFILKRTSGPRARQVERVRRQTTAVGLWLRSTITRRHAATDLGCTVLLVAACSVVAFLCYKGTLDFQDTNPYAWQVIMLWAMFVATCAVVVSWLVFVVRHHVLTYQRLRRARREHLVRQQAEEEEAAHWQFVVQPRPRGSSISHVSGGAAMNVPEFVPRDHRLDTVLETTELSSINPQPVHTPLLGPQIRRSSVTNNPDISVNEDDIIL